MKKTVYLFAILDSQGNFKTQYFKASKIHTMPKLIEGLKNSLPDKKHFAVQVLHPDGLTERLVLDFNED